MNISYYPDMYAVNSKTVISYDSFVETFYDGPHIKSVLKIRKMKAEGRTKKDIKKVKDKMEAVTVSGTFFPHEDSGLIQHSGLLCIDFDGFETIDDASIMKGHMMKCPYIFAAFHSVSGNLAVILKIDPLKHRESFQCAGKYFMEHFGLTSDPSCVNPSRFRFLSYDPDYYQNNDAELFAIDDVYIDETNAIDVAIEKVIIPSSPEDFETLVTKVEDARVDLTDDYHKWGIIGLAICHTFNGEGLTYFKRLSQFHPDYDNKACEKQYEAIQKGIDNVKAGKGKVSLKSIFAFAAEKGIRVPQTVSGRSLEESLTHIKEPDPCTGKYKGYHFWFTDSKQKLRIDSFNFMEFMAANGFYKHYPPGNIEPTYIHIDGSIAKEINISVIKDFISEFILSLPEEIDISVKRKSLYALIFESSANYFSDAKIEWLKPNKRKFFKDSAKEAYTFFSNTIVKITPASYETIPYSSLGDYIVWSHEVKDFNFLKSEDDDCDFKEFMWLISGENIDTFANHISAIGYLMHRHKNPGKCWAIVGCEETETSEKGGGTGKSLIGIAISKMVPTTFIDGKSFDPTKTFIWQKYALGDVVINMDDLNKRFTIEAINSVITSGLTLERKNKPAIEVPFSESPKFYLSTNYVVDESTNAARRRIRKIIVSPFFSPEKQPSDHFGRMFFDEWTLQEWNSFYNFMIGATSVWLQRQEIDVVESVALDVKQFSTKYGDDFLHFMDNCSKLESYQKAQRVSDYWYPNFLDYSGQSIKDYSMKKFSQGLKDDLVISKWPNLARKEIHNVVNYYFDVMGSNTTEQNPFID